MTSTKIYSTSTLTKAVALLHPLEETPGTGTLGDNLAYISVVISAVQREPHPNRHEIQTTLEEIGYVFDFNRVPTVNLVGWYGVTKSKVIKKGGKAAVLAKAAEIDEKAAEEAEEAAKDEQEATEQEDAEN